MRKLTQLLPLIVCLASLYAIAQSPVSKKTVALRATIETSLVRAIEGGDQVKQSSSAVFWRDQEGRTRLEQGSTVTIYDPVSHAMYLLDSQTKKARSIPLPEGKERQRGSASDKTHRRIKLGTTVIDGGPASGERLITILPANSAMGNKKPIQKTTTVWRSEPLQLPVLTIIDDPLIGKLTSRYTNVEKYSSLNPTLFQIPEGYEVTTTPTTSGPRAPKVW